MGGMAVTKVSFTRMVWVKIFRLSAISPAAISSGILKDEAGRNLARSGSAALLAQGPLTVTVTSRVSPAGMPLNAPAGCTWTVAE